jgi:CRISPR-associated protein Cas1
VTTVSGAATGTLRSQIADPSTFYEVWRRLRSDVDGRDGSPGQEFVDLELHLADRVESACGGLLEGTWEPGELRPVTIRDPDGDERRLRVPPLIDRLVERVVVEVLTPVLDPVFTPWSFAYRRGLGVRDALGALAELRDEGFRHVLRTDVKNCFETVDRDLLLARLRQEVDDAWTVELVTALVERRARGEDRPPAAGVPQGGPLSPMLANLLLDQMDKHVAAAGFPLVRYADDITVVARAAEQAGAVLETVRTAAGSIGLELAEEKTRMTTFDEGFFFLGEEIGPVHPVVELAAVQADELLKKALYVTRQGSGVVVRQGQFVVKHDDDELLRVPQSLVAHIVLMGSVGLSAGARATALENGIEVSFLSRRGRWTGRLDGGGAGLAKLRRRQYALSDDQANAIVLARSFVDGKVANQRALLLRYLRRTSIPAVFGAAEAILERRRQLSRATDRDTLMGHEGAAAAAYFDGLRHLLPEWTGFAGRGRRGATDPVNSALNYGYAILLAEVTTAVCVCGLDPVAGFLHGDAGSRPSLSLDLMEEFRPLVVDSTVLNLFKRNRLTISMFEVERTGQVRLAAEGRRRLVAALEERMLTVFSHVPLGKRVSYRRAILLQAQQVTRFVEGKQSVYEPVLWR